MTGMPYHWAPCVARTGAIRQSFHPILLANGMQGSQLWIAAYAKSPLAARKMPDAHAARPAPFGGSQRASTAGRGSEA